MEFVFRGDENGGQFVVDERYGAVFHFGGGIALGVDVADFFEFKRAFEGRWEVVASAKVKEVVDVGVDS